MNKQIEYKVGKAAWGVFPIVAQCPFCEVTNIGLTRSRIASGSYLELSIKCDHWAGWASTRDSGIFLFVNEEQNKDE